MNNLRYFYPIREHKCSDHLLKLIRLIDSENLQFHHLCLNYSNYGQFKFLYHPLSYGIWRDRYNHAHSLGKRKWGILHRHYMFWFNRLNVSRLHSRNRKGYYHCSKETFRSAVNNHNTWRLLDHTATNGSIDDRLPRHRQYNLSTFHHIVFFHLLQRLLWYLMAVEVNARSYVPRSRRI